jgi:tetratricopeptide (TPR) repeat protein
LAITDFDQLIGAQPSAAALRDRGDVYKAQGNFEKAIIDFDAAIRLANSAYAMTDRGDAYLELGQKARALEDFKEAVRIQPDDPEVFQSKGRAEFYLGQWGDAVTDFQKSLALDSSNPYALIWLHLATMRAGGDDAGSLEQQARATRLADWPTPVLNLFLGKLKPAMAIALASDADADKSARQRCEAEFYAGEYLLTQRDATGASPHLEEAGRICSGVFAEVTMAKTELKRLAAGSSK